MINFFDYLSLDFTKITRKKQFIILASILIFIYVLMSIMRPSPHLISDSSVQDFDSIKLYNTDYLTLGSKFYFFSIEKYLISFLNFIAPRYLVLLFIAIFLFSIYLLNLTFDNLKISKDITFLSSLFLTVSPFIIYNIFSLNYYIISIFLIILTLYLDNLFRVKDKKYLYLCLLLIPFLEFESALVFYTFYLFFQLTFRKFNYKILITYVASFIIYLFFTFQKIQFLSANNFFIFKDFDLVSFSNNLISDFGAVSGINIFFMILAMVGLYGILLMRSKLKFMFIFLFFLLVYEIFIPFDNSFYLSFMLTILASMGYILFKNRDWNESEMKNFTLLLVFCGLLFSCASYQIRLGEFEQNFDQENFFNLFNALSDTHLNFENGVYNLNELNSSLNGVLIATNQKYSNLIKTKGGQVMADLNDELITTIDSTHDLNTLFHSTKMEDYAQIIKKYDIDYLYITKEMKSGLEWDHPREGLLINLENKRLFSPVIKTGENEIYRVNKDYFLN